jgi:hypothetical protein
MGTPPGTDGIARETRWLAALIIPFLVVAFVILYGFPSETSRLFAWEIKPPMTAMMLGSAYAGGVWFFARALHAGQWREIKAGFPAVATFASLLGVATVLHWDRFIHGALAFWLWAILYFTTPFLVAGTWLREARRDADARPPESVLPNAIRRLFGGVGLAMILVSAALFVAPDALRTTWPWALTPLTARVMAAMFALPGVVGLGIAADSRWSVARIIVEAQALSIGLILVAAWRDQADIDLRSPAGWLFVGGLGALFVLLVLLWVRFERTNRTAPMPEAASSP